jgi:hypothetical protein
MQRRHELVTGGNSNLALSDLGIRVVAAMMALLSLGGWSWWKTTAVMCLGRSGRRRRIGVGETCQGGPRARPLRMG